MPKNVKQANPIFVARFMMIGAGLIAMSASAAATSLMDVYTQALKNDYIYQGAKAASAAQYQEKNIARSQILPNIRGGVNWNKSEADQTDLVPNLFEGVPDESRASVRESERSGYSIRLDQALIDFSSWNNYKAGSVSANIAEASLEEQGQDLILRVARTYFGALAAVDNLETSKAEEKALGLQLDQTRQRFEVGLTAITDVHEAQAVFDSSTASRLGAEGDVEIAFEDLSVIGGAQYNGLNPLRGGFPVTPPTPNVRQQWVDFALENNLELLVSSLEVKASNYDYKSAKAAHLPSLSTTLSYGRTDSSVGDESGRVFTDRESREQSISFNIDVPIYAGGRVHALRKRAGARAWQQKERYNFTKRGVIQEARSTFIQVTTGVSTVKARQQAIRSNESALEATQAGYDVGTRDLIDVLQAQQSLFRAKRNYSNALYSYINATLLLKKIAGTLSVDDLKSLDEWLNKTKLVTNTF